MIKEIDFYGYRSFVISSGPLELTLTEYGATALSLKRDGKEMLVGFDTLDDYERSGAFVGAIVGRWANRIGGASFELNEEDFELTANEGKNCLHGGDKGGHIVAQGTPEQVAGCDGSYTGEFLRKVLK